MGSIEEKTEAPGATGSRALDPLRVNGLHGVADLLERLAASVWFEDRWLVDDGRSPALLVEGDAALPTLEASRRALVVERIREAVDCIEPSDPLVVASVVSVHGVGELSGSRFRFPRASRVAGEPLALLRQQAVVARDGLVVRVGAPGFLGDGMLGAVDNAALVVYALTGTVDESLVASVKDFRRPARLHRRPPVLDLADSPWEFEELPDRGTDLSSDDFGKLLRRNVRRLPVDAFDALLEFADAGNDTGALLLRGLPVGALPPTPESPSVAVEKDLLSELTLLTIGRLLGQPVGYQPENNGRVVQNIVPTREGASRQVSTSSAVNLAWHTEAAFHPHRPRFLLLFCLRGDAAAHTTLCSVREIVESLSLRTRALLASPVFRTRADESYVHSEKRPLGRLTSVLQGDPSNPTLVFDADLMVGQGDEATAALRELGEAMEAAHTSVVLEPGDLLVVDNTVAVHGRSPFTPRFDGKDRWLQRTFVVSDLAASAGERSGRVIQTRFSGA